MAIIKSKMASMWCYAIEYGTVHLKKGRLKHTTRIGCGTGNKCNGKVHHN